MPVSRRRPTSQRLKLFGVRERNLKNLDIEIPLGLLTCITGVSGSGKSTLVHDVLYAGVKRAKGEWERKLGSFRRLEGAELVSDAVLVDQTPIGRTPRSNPVTYLKAFDPIRELFANTKDAQARGLTPSHFSFNVPGGRCETCEGEGHVRVEMQFLADVFVPCEDCGGKRFKNQVLECRYRARNIDEVLDLTVREALTFFAGAPKVIRRLQVLDEIGLGYLRLGQSATTLSGGEAQRVKIAVAPVPAERRAHALHPGRADHGAALRRHRQAVGGDATSDHRGTHARGDRTQPGRDQDGRLAHRPRTGRGRGWRSRRRHRDAGTGGAVRRVPHRAAPGCRSRGRAAARVRRR